MQTRGNFWRLYPCLILVLTAAGCLAQETIEIGGKVVDAATGQPVAGAKVVLARAGSNKSIAAPDIASAEPSESSQNASEDIQVVLTDQFGAFSFRTVPPAAFMIYAFHSGYVDWGNGIDPSKIIEVSSGMKVKPLRLALHPIGSIAGRIVDADTQNSLAGVEVTPMRWYSGEGSRALIFAGESATSDKQGNYVVKGLAPGDYIIQAVPVSHAKCLPLKEETALSEDRSFARSYFPGVELREQASVVSLIPGGNAEGIDFQLTRTKTGSIRAVVHPIDQERAGAAITIGVTQVEKQGNVSSYSNVAGCKVGDGDEFRIEHLSPGRYWLTAMSEGSPTQRSWAFANVEVDDRPIGPIELNLRRGVPVRGRLTFPEALSSVLAEHGPLRVILSPRGRQRFAGERAPADISFPGGSFILQNVLEGSYQINVAGLPKATAICGLNYNGAKADRNVLTLNPAAIDQVVNLSLCVAAAAIAVTATDGAKAAAGAQLVLLPDPPDLQDLQSEARQVKADEQGQGTFANLVPGRYRVFAFPANSDWRSDPLFERQVVLGSAIEVSPDSIANLTVRLSNLQR